MEERRVCSQLTLQGRQSSWAGSPFLTLVGFFSPQEVGEQERPVGSEGDPTGTRGLRGTEACKDSYHTRVNRTGQWGEPEGQNL